MKNDHALERYVYYYDSLEMYGSEERDLYVERIKKNVSCKTILEEIHRIYFLFIKEPTFYDLVYLYDLFYLLRELYDEDLKTIGEERKKKYHIIKYIHESVLEDYSMFKSNEPIDVVIKELLNGNKVKEIEEEGNG